MECHAPRWDCIIQRIVALRITIDGVPYKRSMVFPSLIWGKSSAGKWPHLGARHLPVPAHPEPWIRPGMKLYPKKRALPSFKPSSPTGGDLHGVRQFFIMAVDEHTPLLGKYTLRNRRPPPFQ